MPTRSDQEAIALRPTAFFEGGSPTGSFDGMGLSMGTIQFNLGMGTLQPVLKMMSANGPQTFARICGADLAAEILRICDASVHEAIAWGDAHSTGADKQHVTEPLRSALVNLWREPVFAAIDRHFCARYLDDARADCAFYGVNTLRALAFFFDCSVQRGPAALGATAKQAVIDEFAGMGGHALAYLPKLIALAHVQADQCSRPEYRPLCLARRLAIVMGHGTVYGDAIDVDGRFGITDEALV